jgi:DNA-binding GntR family transcriptional regulator
MNSRKRTRGEGAQKIYSALKQQILSMALMPGHSLDELGLAETFGVSRSPVREALLHLCADGLATSLPNKSTIVSPLNVELFPQYIDALDLVQRAVTHLAAIKRTDADIETIQQRQAEFSASIHSGDAVTMIERNRDFHMAIAEASKNPYLSRNYEKLLDEGRRFLRLYFRSYGDTMPSDFPDEHGLIIEAIVEQDAPLAEQRAHQHTMEFHGRFIGHMSERLTDPIAVNPVTE